MPRYFENMIIINNCIEQIDAEATAITIGTFDGVHKGHQKILCRLQEVKKQTHLKSLLFTFHPHPRKIIQSHPQSIKILSTKEEKIQLLQPFDIDYLVFCPFTKEFANIPPQDFVRYLCEKLKMKYIIIGYDHKFGKDRQGNIHTFIEMKNQYQYEVEQIPAETIDEINISSTQIRKYLMDGQIEMANHLLGYTYFISGKVIEGKKLGQKIGIPTANIQIDDADKLIPHNGVYCTTVKINNQTYQGVMNIGTNPTTDHDGHQKLEVHIFHFNQNIYHQNIQVSFLKRIRDEKKFESIDTMKSQIMKDIDICQCLTLQK